MLKKKLRNQKGFTLIEIIAVLVILGILAAVAIPKYLGLQEEAELAAAKAAIAEFNGRASISYAKMLVKTGTADGAAAGGYQDFDGAIIGWTPAAALTVDFTALKRTDGTATFASGWVAGSTGGPGYWSTPTRN